MSGAHVADPSRCMSRPVPRRRGDRQNLRPWLTTRSGLPVESVRRRRQASRSRRSSSSIEPPGRRWPRRRRCRCRGRDRAAAPVWATRSTWTRSRHLPAAVPAAEHVRRAAPARCTRSRPTSCGERTARTPFVIGVAGSVAVGKSTTARVLREMLARWPDTPRVELVTTDGFLYPNAVLEQRNLMQRKGFPESYDRRALLRFVAEVKSGAAEVRAPRYDHLTYDILPGDEIVVRRPDVLIVEGLNVLQPARLDDGGTVAARWPCRTSSTSPSTSTRHRRRPPLVRRAVPAAAGDRVRPPRFVLPPVRGADRRRGGGAGRPGSGRRSTNPTWWRTSCPPGAGRPW